MDKPVSEGKKDVCSFKYHEDETISWLEDLHWVLTRRYFKEGANSYELNKLCGYFDEYGIGWWTYHDGSPPFYSFLGYL